MAVEVCLPDLQCGLHVSTSSHRASPNSLAREVPAHCSSSPTPAPLQNLPVVRETGLHPGAGKIPWRRKWQPAPAHLPGESHGWRSPVGCRPWGRRVGPTERLPLPTSSPKSTSSSSPGPPAGPSRGHRGPGTLTQRTHRAMFYLLTALASLL